MILVFLFLLFGLLVGFRTNRISVERKKKYFLTFVSIFLLWKFIIIRRFCLFAVVFLAGYYIFQKIERWRMQRRFRRVFRLFLNQVILLMVSGKSFRHSFRESLVQFDLLSRRILAEIYEIVTFSQQLPQTSGAEFGDFERRVLQKLIIVDKNPQNPVTQLKNFRTELELTDFFRHRSRQATSAIRFQAMVLFLLYMGLLVFVIQQFGWGVTKVPILASLPLFTAGGIVFYFMGRKRRWRL